MRTPLLVVLSLALAPPVGADTSTIDYGQTVAGTLAADGDQDVYTFTAPASGRVFVRVISTSGEQSASVLVQHVGVGQAASGGGIGPVMTIAGVPVVGGDAYEVRVPAAPTGSGYPGQTYRLQLQSLTAPVGATPVSIGGGGSGSLDQSGEADFFTVDAAAGDEILFTTTRTSGTVDPEVVLFLPQYAGTCSPSFDAEPDHPSVLTQCGASDFDVPRTYTFWVDDLDDDTPAAIGGTDTGAYGFTVACLSGPCLSATTTSTAAATTTTTSTITPGGTTTTTLAPAVTSLVDGKRLAIKAPAAKPAKRAFAATCTDADVSLGGGNGSADDPRIAGATLRIRSAAASFDVSYPLPASRWKTVGQSGQNKGYVYADSAGAVGPVRKVTFKPKQLVVTARGSGLAVSLATNPNPVDVAFTVGGLRVCSRYGGTATFVANKKFVAKLAPAPPSCP